MTVVYLTDVEGRWDKLAAFVDGNPHVALCDDRLELAEGVTFVFGGDAVDRGPHGRRFVQLLVDAHARYGDRVVLLAGNRDINKLRLVTELGGSPHRRVPGELADPARRGELLRWTLAHTMGAGKAFDHRVAELAASGLPHDDDAVVASFLDDVAPGGGLRAYLAAARLGYRAGATLFLHGGITPDNFLVTPGRPDARDVDAWLATLAGFYRDEFAIFEAGRRPDALIAYQSQDPATKLNQKSVVYARPTDEHGNPHLPPAAIVDRLRAWGIRRLVVGHTPSGDCPAIVRDRDFELVLADNSYGRIETGSQVSLDDDTLTVRGTTELDDGRREPVRFTIGRDEPPPLGHRISATRRLVKARLERGDYLVFRGLSGYRVEQLAEPPSALATERVEIARSP